MTRTSDHKLAGWRGCRMAVNHADYWHAARDFAPATLCGLPLEGSGLSELRVTNGMTPHTACIMAANTTRRAPHLAIRPPGPTRTGEMRATP
jgi:hypothetical protein